MIYLHPVVAQESILDAEWTHYSNSLAIIHSPFAKVGLTRTTLRTFDSDWTCQVMLLGMSNLALSLRKLVNILYV